jgi:hypothetical protein
LKRAASLCADGLCPKAAQKLILPKKSGLGQKVDVDTRLSRINSRALQFIAFGLDWQPAP